MIKSVILVAAGSLFGGLAGYFGRCASGTCPLTATPWRGAFFGALVACTLVLSNASFGAKAEEKDTAVIHIASETQFEQAVLKSTMPVVVDFFATWCPPCRMLGPKLETLASETSGQALVVKVDVDKNPALARKYAVRGIPDVRIFVEGKQKEKIVGLRNKSFFAEKLTPYLKK
jgi:thioredoxin